MLSKEEIINLTTYDHNFGIIIPKESGFIWEQQTDGCACNHVYIEGIYIPLPLNKILEKIQDANYRFKPRLINRYWKELEKHLEEHERLTFEKVEAPEHQPHNEEGLQWIKIIKWGIFNSDAGYENGYCYYPFNGQIVALIYPNCD